MKHSKLILGFILGFCFFALLSASTYPDSTNNTSRYHLTFIGNSTNGYVYNASTGEIKETSWRDVNKVSNIKELLNK